MSQAPADTSAPEPVRALVTLQQLSLEAGLAATRRQLIFHILNRTIALCSYDRAALWDLSSRRPRLLGISGDASVDSHAPLIQTWQACIASLRAPETMQPIQPDALTDATALPRLRESLPAAAFLWVPIRCEDETAAGLWLERWDGRTWTEAERGQLQTLALGYGVAWRVFERPARWRRWLRARRRWAAAALLLLLVLALAFDRVPLRVVAPCTVIPKKPVAVTAPMDGVIEAVRVEPNATVEKDAPLADYDRRVILEQHKVSLQKVAALRARLNRLRVEAIDDPQARATLPLLAEQVKEEEARLGLATYRLERTAIRAPAGGTVLLPDPDAWRGRPVQAGERILTLVDPAATAVEVWLPVRDVLPTATARPVEILLANEPETTYAGTLAYIERTSRLDPTGQPCFVARVLWKTPPETNPLGIRGTAVLYGPRVRLGYWLARKPWSAVRAYLGW